jgi:hypothetical protein
VAVAFASSAATCRVWSAVIAVSAAACSRITRSDTIRASWVLIIAPTAPITARATPANRANFKLLSPNIYLGPSMAISIPATIGPSD